MHKDERPMAILVLIVFCVAIVFVFAVQYSSTRTENNRLYEKCLVEHKGAIFEQAVAVCKERVK